MRALIIAGIITALLNIVAVPIAFTVGIEVGRGSKRERR
jgi:hypothetical protein